MTIRKRLSFGIAILLVLFLALGVVLYFHLGKIDDNLTRIMQGRELGKRSALLYQQYKTLDDTITNKKNSQDALFDIVAGNFENINNIIDEKIQTGIELKVPHENEKILKISKIKTGIAEIGIRLGTHPRIPKEDYQKRIFNATQTLEQEIDKLKTVSTTEEEKTYAIELETTFKQTIPAIKNILIISIGIITINIPVKC